MAKRLLPAFCFLIWIVAQVWPDAPLIEAFDPAFSEPWTLDARLESGFESGYIPDVVVAPRLEVTLPKGVRVGLDIDGTYLADQRISRIDRSGLDVSYSFLPRSSSLQLAAVVGGDFAWNSAIVVPYTGSTGGISNVTSPRTDGGFDLTGAVAASLPLPWARFLGLALATEMRYDFTGGRSGYESQYGFLPGSHRVTGILALESSLPRQHLDFALQNRLLYWYSRGFAYEVLPQVTWSPRGPWRVQGGIGIPFVGGGSWRLIVSGGFELALKPPAAKKPSVERTEIRRLVMNFQFEGDRADLLEPKNMRYGKENARLIAQAVAVLKEYPKSSIVIEGNANRANFSLSFEEEQRRELIPLSLARAQSVRNALVDAGIPEGQVRAIGNGAAKPLVDFHDLANVWKNRRVEIVIQGP